MGLPTSSQVSGFLPETPLLSGTLLSSPAPVFIPLRRLYVTCKQERMTREDEVKLHTLLIVNRDLFLHSSQICLANQCSRIDQLTSKRCPRTDDGKECAGKGVIIKLYGNMT